MLDKLLYTLQALMVCIGMKFLYIYFVTVSCVLIS